MIAYEWAGPRTYLRLKSIARGSAAGGTIPSEVCLMAGRDSRGRAVSACGRTYEPERLSRKLDDPTQRVCSKCETKAAAK